MKHTASILATLALAATVAHAAATKASTVTSNYITWTFDKEYEVGQFVNGDWWVLGPVKIVAIDNSMSDKTYLPEDEEVSGSMINPTVDAKTERFSAYWQGYDSRANHYRPELNAARPNDKPLSADNPILLAPNQSLVSMVSWLWRTPEDREPGCPVPCTAGARGAKVGRPTIRTGAVLTVLAEAPPAGTFRPSYAGDEKRLFNISQLKRDRLLALPPLPPVEGLVHAGSADPEDLRRSDRYPSWAKDKNDPPPALPGRADELSLYWSYGYGADLALLTRATARPWIDHIPSWYGGTVFHPSINLPNYGRELCHILQTAMLALHLDWTKIEGAPATKDDLLINMVQIGIDLAGCADAGTWWPGDGGHHAGRKPAILFAGLLLDDPHMKNVGHWPTIFQENDYTMYITQEHVEKTNADTWRPDTRGGHVAPYTAEMIGMPEYVGYNAGWSMPYRDNNISYYIGFALTALMMEARPLWNHEPFFDYTDRATSAIDEATKHMTFNRPPAFVRAMWDAYRKNYPTTYDKKWDDEKILQRCLTERFLLVAAPKRYGIFELKDDEPIRMTVGHPVDLTALSPQTVTVTGSDGETLPVAAIEAADNPGAYFTIKFAEGVQLKPGIIYTATVDQKVSDKWRNAIDMKPLSNKTTFTVR